MAALSDATVIIEAGDTSGTLHQAAECVTTGTPTLHHPQHDGRPVAAVAATVQTVPERRDNVVGRRCPRRLVGMPLKVFCCCTYRTSGRDWTQRDWAACFFIKAIKNKPIKGYARVPLPDGTQAYLDKTTAASAPAWFAEIVAKRIRWHTLGPVALVPIPDSSCTLGSSKAPRTLAMATALADRLPHQAMVADILRWNDAQPSAHQAGGTRDPELLYSRLRLAGAPVTDRRSVLIDDVLSSGGHLQAAAAFLSRHGSDVAGGVCAGRADNEFVGEDAFAMRIDSIPDYSPM